MFPRKNSSFLFPFMFLLGISLVQAAPPLSKNASKVRNPFLSLQFDRVEAYDYNSGEGRPIVDKKGKLPGSIAAQKALTGEQIARIGRCLGDVSTYGGNTAMCFQPRLGLVYFKGKKVVAHVSICLECNYLESSVNIPAIEAQEKIHIGEEYWYYAKGFSKKGRKFLYDFCRELRFPNCLEKLDSMFDE